MDEMPIMLFNFSLSFSILFLPLFIAPLIVFFNFSSRLSLPLPFLSLSHPPNLSCFLTDLISLAASSPLPHSPTSLTTPRSHTHGFHVSVLLSHLVLASCSRLTAVRWKLRLSLDRCWMRGHEPLLPTSTKVISILPCRLEPSEACFFCSTSTHETLVIATSGASRPKLFLRRPFHWRGTKIEAA